jgi:DNA repair protein RAD16
MASGKATRAPRVARQSASSRSSFASSTRDNSIGYDTPATSAVATPAAEGSFAGRRGFNLGGAAMNASNKRKRNSAATGSSHAESSRAAQVEAVDMSMDAQLARRLQAEEYGDEEEDEADQSGVNNDFVINDSNDELESVSVLFAIFWLPADQQPGL